MLKPYGYLLTFLLFISMLTLNEVHTAEPALPTKKSLEALVFSDEPNPLLQQILNGIHAGLKKDSSIAMKEEFLFWKRQSNWKQELSNIQHEVLIVIGDSSYHKVKHLTLKTPVIYLWLSDASLQELKDLNRPNTFAITYKQPLIRYFALIKALNVYQSFTGTLLDKPNAYKREQQKELAKFYNLPLRTIFINNEYKGKDAIEQLSQCCNVYLVLEKNDSTEGVSQRSIIINSARNRLITIAYSPSLLQDGAMIALYSAPYPIGLQGSELIQKAILSPSSNSYQEPDDFTLKINRNVAKILGYSDISLGEMMTKIKTLEYLYIQIGRMR